MHGFKLFVTINRTLSLLFLCCGSTHCPGGPMSLDAAFPVSGGGGLFWVYGQMVCIYMNAWALGFIISRTLRPGRITRGENSFQLSLVLILWLITLSVSEEVTQFKRSHSIPFFRSCFSTLDSGEPRTLLISRKQYMLQPVYILLQKHLSFLRVE